MILFLICVVLIGIAFALLGIKMFFKKDGKFEKHCASIELVEGEIIRCASCQGAENHEDCPNYELHHGNTASLLNKD